MTLPTLDDGQLNDIANIIGKSLSGTQIKNLLDASNIKDVQASYGKPTRLYEAFKAEYSQTKSSNHVWAFLLECFKPSRGVLDTGTYELLRCKVNEVISLSGVEVRNDGHFYSVPKANNVSEAKQRSNSLIQKLRDNRAHCDVIKFCNEELLADDYFHAVHEAAKSLCDKVRELSGLNKDGSSLFEEALCTKNPYIALSSLTTSTEINEQRGLCDMLCGVYSMVRNVTAHELRIKWIVHEEDALDILLVISFLHKKLDQCVKVPKYNSMGIKNS